MAIIKTENLTKKFKELVAVNGVGLEIEDGECLGLLGPNGAGKTSLIRMITGVSPATAGDIFWGATRSLMTGSAILAMAAAFQLSPSPQFGYVISIGGGGKEKRGFAPLRRPDFGEGTDLS